MTTETLSPLEADALWRDLRDAFTAAHTAIRRIIETRAWEPLGYATFSDAWDERMAGQPLATTEAKAWVVYTMLDEGRSSLDIDLAISGVGARAIEALKRQKDNGVPPRAANIKVVTPQSHSKPYLRNATYVAPRGARRSVHVRLDDSDYGRFVALAERQGMTVPKQAERAILAYLDRGGEL